MRGQSGHGLMRPDEEKIIQGAKEAVEFARVERCIMDWIRDEGTIVVKMHMTPKMVRQIASRITGATVYEK